ncbi:MAG: hypothetical protein GWN30_32005, partial [Gammaproteobacteria bacterium]|nr:hypothetical protein [Gammaproteobacteria bacterium]
MTTQILDFSRQSILDRQSIDLVPFLESFATLLGRTLPENIEIELDHEADSYVIMVDSGRIQQALMNLVLNSRDAMPDGGWIRLGIETIDYEPEEERPITELGEVDWVR